MANRSDAAYRILACMHMPLCRKRTVYFNKGILKACSDDHSTRRTWKAGQGISSSKAEQELAPAIAVAGNVLFVL
jgi:hypothetical protein